MSSDDSESSAPVLVDTDVFSRVFIVQRRDDEANAWIARLAGCTVVIAVQTAVELRSWPQLRNWNESHTQQLIDRIRSVPAIQVSQLVQDRYVELTVWAKRSGHGIYDKSHTADRWIAATAMAHDLELASGDGIFSGIEGLRLLAITP